MAGAFEFAKKASHESDMPRSGGVGGPGAVTSTPAASKGPAPPTTFSGVSNNRANLPSLELLARMAGGAKPNPSPKKFTPGKKHEPKSGYTVHDVFKDPHKLAHLAKQVTTWEGQNPSRRIKGPHVKGMFPEMSDAQARSVASRIQREKDKHEAAKRDGYFGKGARAALKKGS